MKTLYFLLFAVISALSVMLSSPSMAETVNTKTEAGLADRYTENTCPECIKNIRLGETNQTFQGQPNTENLQGGADGVPGVKKAK